MARAAIKGPISLTPARSHHARLRHGLINHRAIVRVSNLRPLCILFPMENLDGAVSSSPSPIVGHKSVTADEAGEIVSERLVEEG